MQHQPETSLQTSYLTQGTLICFLCTISDVHRVKHKYFVLFLVIYAVIHTYFIIETICVIYCEQQRYLFC